ncbi:MAG TPA: hypothetical protein GXZ32_09055 [Clostridiales bacterium]|nr:hypothetical protein [Clostridiales bacterium]
MKDILIWILVAIIFFLLIKLGKNEKKTKKYYDTAKRELKELFLTSEEMLLELEDLSEKLLKKLDVKYKEINKVLQRIEGYDINKIGYNGSKVSGLTGNETMDSRKIKEGDHGPLPDKYYQVHELNAKGYDLTQIAKTLNMGKGEIKLILNMDKIAHGENLYKDSTNRKTTG